MSPSPSESQLARAVAAAIRAARLAMGWSQDELGRRTGISQPTISRLERALHSGVDLAGLDRLGSALGGRFDLTFRAPFLEDRVRQQDAVHARCVAYPAARLRRAGWTTETEVEIRGAHGSGWIDVLRWHPPSGWLVVGEVKTEIHDAGRIQRTLAWYERGAWAAARRLGWRPQLLRGLLLVLDSAAVRERLRENRALFDLAFPIRADRLASFLADPSSGAVRSGRGLAAIDPLSRRMAWLRPTTIDGRRTAPAYENYAECVRRLRG